MDDTITSLLRGVADGSITVDDARTALEGADLTEEQMTSAIDHGVFNVAEPGTIVSASLAPSGGSYLTMFFFAWGVVLDLLLEFLDDLRIGQGLGSASNSPSTWP